MTNQPAWDVNKHSMVSLRDWRAALRTPHPYRVGNSTLRIQSPFLALSLIVLTMLLLFYAYPRNQEPKKSLNSCARWSYNRTYPLSSALKSVAGTTYRIAVISDLDHASRSKEKDTWFSLLQKGWLRWAPDKNLIDVTWDEGVTSLSSSLGMKGRGMELSELITFDGRLLAVDDRTGMIYSVEGDQVYPWVILMDGNGRNSKGFKSEWATVKDEQLYVGSMGKEWTTSSGEFVNNNPQWVKTVSPLGETHSLNWVSNYNKLRQAIGIDFPGYMIHESGMWSDVHKSWFFLPRRCSKERYNETKDEMMGCNVMLTADENFSSIKVTKVGNLIPVRGFASFKFLPGSNDSIIVALKTEENQGRTATYIMAFTIEGTVLLPELKIIDKKFEGLEFI